MPRYKTVGFAQCEKGHMQTVDSRLMAESEDKAQAATIANVRKQTCDTCGGRITIFRIAGTEEISSQVEYWVHGYTCHCGERVEVYRVEVNMGFTPPASKTVSCSRGHSRTVSNQMPEYMSLQKWTEKAN